MGGSPCVLGLAVVTFVMGPLLGDLDFIASLY